MENLYLESMLAEYMLIKEKEDNLKKRKEELSNNIKDVLREKENGKYENELYKASIVNKTTFKYNDILALISYIISKGLSDMYLVKEIDTTKFNKELKTKGKLYDAVKNYITENIVENLVVGDK